MSILRKIETLGRGVSAAAVCQECHRLTQRACTREVYVDNLFEGEIFLREDLAEFEGLHLPHGG